MPWSDKSSTERGYGYRWQQLRLRVLRRDGYLCQCRRCRETGTLRPATEVDHVLPKAKGGTDAEDNLQAINTECHKIKSIADSGRNPFSRPQIGLDGWPLANR